MYLRIYNRKNPHTYWSYWISKLTHVTQYVWLHVTTWIYIVFNQYQINITSTDPLFLEFENVDINHEDVLMNFKLTQRDWCVQLVSYTYWLRYHLLDSLVVDCWHRVWKIPGPMPSQGPRHTKDVIKMVPVVPLFNTQHWKGKLLALSQELR